MTVTVQDTIERQLVIPVGRQRVWEAITAPDQVATFGSDVPLARAGQPSEVATCFLFLASQDSSYMTGQVLHPNGGEIVNA